MNDYGRLRRHLRRGSKWLKGAQRHGRKQQYSGKKASHTTRRQSPEAVSSAVKKARIHGGFMKNPPMATRKKPSLPPSHTEDDLRTGLEKAGGFLHEIFARLPAILKVERSDVLLMHDEIDQGARIQSLPYWLFLFASCGIATMGLITNSPAVIIGAMLISPLMAPIIGLGMGVALSDLYLGTKSLFNLFASVTVAIVTAALITVLVPLHDDTTEILARTSPTVLDLFIAVLCGLVAALSSVRSSGENVLGNVAPGAAIGVALMPPLCVVGYGLGSGFRGEMMWGAFLLFLTNLFSIVLVSSAFYYFIYEGYNINRLVSLLVGRRQKKEPFFNLLSRIPLWQRIDESLSSRKRFLFPLILMLLISYPLMSSLVLLKKKTDLRNFLSGELRSASGLQVIRGPEQLNYSGDSITGSILYSSDQDNDSLEEQIHTKLKQRFADVEPKFRLIRIVGEADLETLQKAGIPDPAVEASNRLEQALLLTDHIHKAMMRRFPPEAGIILRTQLITSARGIDSVQIRYAGEALDRGSLNLVGSTLRQELEAQGYATGEVQIIHSGSIERTGGCKERSDLKAELLPLLDPLRANREIGVILLLRPETSIDADFLKSFGERLTVRYNGDAKCQFRLTYTRLP